MNKTRRKVIVVGMFLLLCSTPPLYLMGQELVLAYLVNQTVQMERISTHSEGNKATGSPDPIPNVSIRSLIWSGETFDVIPSKDQYDQMIQRVDQPSMIYAKEYSWEGHTIRIQDEFRPGFIDMNVRQYANLSILINDTDWSSPGTVISRPAYLDENRYHGFFGILHVKEQGQEKLVLVQRISVANDFHQNNSHGVCWKSDRTDGSAKTTSRIQSGPMF